MPRGEKFEFSDSYDVGSGRRTFGSCDVGCEGVDYSSEVGELVFDN